MALGPYQDIVEVSHDFGGPEQLLEFVEGIGFEKGLAYSKRKMYCYAGGTLAVGTVVGTVVTTSVAKFKARRQRKKEKRASIKIECGDLGENFHIEFSCTGSDFQNSSVAKEVAV